VVTNLPPTQGFFMLGGPIRPGFDQQILAANDDSSTPLVPLPFIINFLGNPESGLFVNNNGNVSFDKPLSAYSPVSLAAAGVKIIAPFWADVDTRNPLGCRAIRNQRRPRPQCLRRGLGERRLL